MPFVSTSVQLQLGPTFALQRDSGLPFAASVPQLENYRAGGAHAHDRAHAAAISAKTLDQERSGVWRYTGSVPDRLVRVVSPAAATTELHAMTMDGNLMKMRPVAGLDIPAGSRVALGSGGYHVMLIDLERPLAAGDTVVLTLTFAKAGSIEISAPVEASAGAAAPARTPAHAH